MKKLFTLFTLLFVMATVNAQTSEQLVGEWKLVSWKKSGGKEVDINDYFKTTEVYQVFSADGKFESIVGEKTHKGKWKLSNDNKELTIIVAIANETFSVDYFDAKRRVISNSTMGTLEYEKVE